MLLDKLEKALANDDTEAAKELIDEMRQLLGQAETMVPKTKRKTTRKKKVTAKKKPYKRDEEAVTRSIIPEKKKAVARKFKNTFIDKGTEHQDEDNVTPYHPPVERRPGVKKRPKVSATCWVCGKTSKVAADRLDGTGVFEEGEFKGQSCFRCDKCCERK